MCKDSDVEKRKGNDLFKRRKIILASSSYYIECSFRICDLQLLLASFFFLSLLAVVGAVFLRLSFFFSSFTSVLHSLFKCGFLFSLSFSSCQYHFTICDSLVLSSLYICLFHHLLKSCSSHTTTIVRRGEINCFWKKFCSNTTKAIQC